MRRVIGLLMLIIVLASAGCAGSNKAPFKHDQDTVDELNKILSGLDDETAKTTVEALLSSPVEINRRFLLVDDACQRMIYFSEEFFIDEGDYIQYACKYGDESGNGSVKISYITVYAEATKDGELVIPLHLYACKRVLEKHTGFIEPYTAPEWDNSYAVVGLKEE